MACAPPAHMAPAWWRRNPESFITSDVHRHPLLTCLPDLTKAPEDFLLACVQDAGECYHSCMIPITTHGEVIFQQWNWKLQGYGGGYFYTTGDGTGSGNCKVIHDDEGRCIFLPVMTKDGVSFCRVCLFVLFCLVWFGLSACLFCFVLVWFGLVWFGLVCLCLYSNLHIVDQYINSF